MNITYLFGAGASANAIPTIEHIQEHLKEFHWYLDRLEDSPPGPTVISSQGSKIYREKRSSQLKKDIKWLIKELENATSIDTFAKRLFIKKSNDYLKLKALMLIFFIFEHFKNSGAGQKDISKKFNPQNIASRKIDHRYDNFFASLIHKDVIELPNIKILSWNYDMQFELAFDEYLGKNNIIEDQIHLQIFPSNEARGFDKKRFGILKLNGSLQIQRKEDEIIPLLYSEQSFSIYTLVKNLINDYISLTITDRPFPFLFFSWEENNISLQTKKIARDIAYETDILVVIGYSFPYFNRGWDKDIFGNLKQLQKVYFQAPREDLENYLPRFKAIYNQVSLYENISDLKQFFIPPELS